MFVGLREPWSAPPSHPVEQLDLAGIAPGVLGYAALQKKQALVALQRIHRTSRVGHFALSESTMDDGCQSDALRRQTLQAAELELAQAIEETRETVNALPAEHKDRFSRDMSLRLANLEENTRKAIKSGMVYWAGWIGTDASSTEVLNFCAWNAHHLHSTQQEPSFKNGVELVKQECDYGLLEGIRLKTVDPTAEDTLPNIRNIQVMVSDYTDMAAQDRGGFTEHGSDRIFVAESIFGVTNQLRRTMRHEIGHAAIGQFDDKLRDEVITEQYAHALVDGAWLRVHPFDHELPGSYSSCRELVSLLYPKKREVRLLTLLYSSQTDEAVQRHQEKMFKLQDNSSRNTIGAVEELMRRAESVGAEHGVPYNSAIETASRVLLALKVTGFSELRPELTGYDNKGKQILAREVDKAVMALRVPKSVEA